MTISPPLPKSRKDLPGSGATIANILPVWGSISRSVGKPSFLPSIIFTISLALSSDVFASKIPLLLPLYYMQKTGGVQKEQKIIRRAKTRPRLNRLLPADRINSGFSCFQNPDHQAVGDADNRRAGPLNPAGGKASLPGAEGFLPPA